MKEINTRYSHSAQKTYNSMPDRKKVCVNRFVTKVLKKPETLKSVLNSSWVTSETRIVHSNCEEEVYTISFPKISLQIKFSFARGNREKVNIEEIW